MSEDKSLDEVPITRNLLAVVITMLDGFGYNYQELDPTTIYFAVGNPQGLYQVYFTASDETDLVRVIGYYGSRVPVDRRLAVLEAIARLNWQSLIGAFDLDLTDGTLRFRIGMDVESGLLSEKMADNMLGLTMFMMNKYHESLMRVAFGDADPETAIVEVP